jgi:hypothetical protein
MATRGEKVLAMELLGFVLIQTGNAFYRAGATGQKGALGGPLLPQPSQYFAGLIVFTTLAAAAAVSERLGRLAAAFGGLALLALALRPNNAGGTPPVVGFLRWLATMYQHPPATLASPVPPVPAGGLVPGPGGVVLGPPVVGGVGPGGGNVGGATLGGGQGGPAQYLPPGQSPTTT